MHNDYVIEPQDNIPVLIPRCMYSQDTIPRQCLVNASDRSFTTGKGTVIGEAVEARQVGLDVEKKSVPELFKSPDHLKQLVDKSAINLNENQQEQLGKFMFEYADFFDENEFDVGNFKEIEHSIDTGSATPIKQRMRRTPLDFVHQEEAHLETILNAGIIEPSTSEWASPPVLIRKRFLIFRNP